jgi:hypothetical protein
LDEVAVVVVVVVLEEEAAADVCLFLLLLLDLAATAAAACLLAPSFSDFMNDFISSMDVNKPAMMMMMVEGGTGRERWSSQKG